MLRRMCSLMLFMHAFAPASAQADILPLEQGLTLAETHEQPARVLLVLREHDRRIEALDLSALSGMQGDAVSLLQRLGVARIRELARAALQEQQEQPEQQAPQVNQALQAGRVESLDVEQLASPAGAGQHHIGLGFNYPEHADEVQQAAEPFLFLKRSLATREEPLVSRAGQLLDYEVEICARVLAPVSAAEALVDTPLIGFFLCGDFTDRALLLRQMDHDNVGSGRGFGVAKSQPGFFPTGPWLVVPDDASAFAAQVQLSLSVNDELRQLAAMRDMIWDLPRLLAAVADADRAARPTHFSDQFSWLAQGRWREDICLLTGTPAGVVMRPPSTGFRLASGVLYVLSGAVFGDATLRQYAIERYIRQLQEARVFLQPGDKLRLQASFLGAIDLHIR